MLFCWGVVLHFLLRGAEVSRTCLNFVPYYLVGGCEGHFNKYLREGGSDRAALLHTGRLPRGQPFFIELCSLAALCVVVVLSIRGSCRGLCP